MTRAGKPRFFLKKGFYVLGWPIADSLPTLVVTHQLQVERRTGKANGKHIISLKTNLQWANVEHHVKNDDENDEFHQSQFNFKYEVYL